MVIFSMPINATAPPYRTWKWAGGVSPHSISTMIP